MTDRRRTTTISSRDFNQHPGRARTAARRGPVIITDRGRPAYVLLGYEQYQRLAAGESNIIDLLGAPAGIEDVDLDVPALRDRARTARLSW